MAKLNKFEHLISFARITSFFGKQFLYDLQSIIGLNEPPRETFFLTFFLVLHPNFKAQPIKRSDLQHDDFIQNYK